MSGKPLTGGKVLAILLCAFGVIIGANLAMLFAATGTFPGLVVKNSYVASQQWNAKTDAQNALGWQAGVAHENGKLRVKLTDATGAPVHGLEVTAVIGRPASGREDVALELVDTGGTYAAPATLGPGLWRVALRASDGNGSRYEAKTELFIGEPG